MKEKEWTDEELLGIGLYFGDDTRVAKEKHCIVKTRKPHECVYCEKEFEAGTRMRKDSWLNCETGEFDTAYYCVPCLVKDEDLDTSED